MDLKFIESLSEKVIGGVSSVLVGKEAETRLLLTALIAKGHVLLEDVPGTGKTVLAKCIARLLDCSFSRIQCTPDLLPSDITGVSIYEPKTAQFTFHKGPVFTQILLADELNRATPRTQAALLECMEERQITESGETTALPEPFLVIATQNPIETAGTFPLPEAQLDRFLMRLRLGYPDAEGSKEALKRFMSAEPLYGLEPLASAEELKKAQQMARNVTVSEIVRGYMVDIAEKTRADEELRLGVSTRGLISLMRASQAYALISGRDFVTPDDIKALAEPVLAHRLITRVSYAAAEIQAAALARAVSAATVPAENPSEAL
ncbi:MAG: MoxR family ATPase [Eubacteriales bacterium]|nr:MoxR family ATPase [Eubacteriales bacterium]MDD3883219.1 MoxR family ATPase [Eubacteriales bacterium]MDD4513829.1 MoxR family ATPase [Eubacteriales bacterium]